MKHYFIYPHTYDLKSPFEHVNSSKITGYSLGMYPDFNIVECKVFSNKEFSEFSETFKYKPEVSDIDFSAHKKFYFMPGCTIPRYKVNDLLEKHNAASIRDPKKADVVITHKGIIDRQLKKCFLSYKSFEIDKNTLDIYLSLSKVNDFKFSAGSLLEGILHDPNVKLWGLPNTNHHLKLCVTGIAIPTTFSNDERYNHGSLNHILSLDVDNVLANLHFHKAADEKILSGLLGETEIDEEMCKGIEDLLKSDNRSDVAMAINVMVNSSFEKSYFRLMYLVHTYYQKLHTTKEAYLVGFKSLKEYIGFSKSHLSRKNGMHHIDHVIKAAIQNGMYDDTFMQKIYDVYPAEFDYIGSKYVKPLTFMLTDLGKGL
jgi:hypothetical protein